MPSELGTNRSFNLFHYALLLYPCLTFSASFIVCNLHAPNLHTLSPSDPAHAAIVFSMPLIAYLLANLFAGLLVDLPPCLPASLPPCLPACLPPSCLPLFLLALQHRPGWVGGVGGPEKVKDDFARLGKELMFKHLVSGHGAVLRDDAHAQVLARVAQFFKVTA